MRPFSSGEIIVGIWKLLIGSWRERKSLSALRKADRRERDFGLTPKREFSGEGMISGSSVVEETPLSL